MCGIAALILSSITPSLPKDWPFWGGTHGANADGPPCSRTPTVEDLLTPLLRRGPDQTNKHELAVGEHITIQAISTVLSLRGTIDNRSTDDSGNGRRSEVMVLFNGEIYAHGNVELEGTDSDTKFLKNLVCGVIYREDQIEDEGVRLLAELDALKGPWSVIIWSPVTKRLYFARDRVGRRSLLIQVVQNESVVVTSTPPAHLHKNFLEVPPNGLIYLDFLDDSVALGLAPRERASVEPQRMTGRKEALGESAVVAGSQARMYVSFLPRSWLRTMQAPCEESDLGVNTVAGSTHAAAFLSLLRRAVDRRLRRGVQAPEVALLFSGGVDSMVLAQLLAEQLPIGADLTLVNVAFGDTSDAVSRCPDREASEAGLSELRLLNPTREITLLRVDVSSADARAAACSTVPPLTHPCAHLMDASIGTALWAAARAIPPAVRIVHSGLGADELMAGYKGRHRAVCAADGLHGLKQELDADLSRLWFRNLGRDDRIFASFAKELRHPFLDEDVVSFVAALPLVPDVCDLDLPDGVGDKALLRQAATLLGLSHDTATRAKRAIQFGSRSKHVIERKTPVNTKVGAT